MIRTKFNEFVFAAKGLFTFITFSELLPVARTTIKIISGNKALIMRLDPAHNPRVYSV